MRIPSVAIVATFAGYLCVSLAAQAPSATPASSVSTSAAQPASATVPAASPASPTPATEKPVLPSGLLVPSLNGVQQAFASLKLEKWKRGSVRDEAGDNVKEVLHDIKATLPDLMKAADSGADVVSKTLPLSRNVDALYDVMLRVYEASRVAAPPDQVAQIQQALASLKSARMALDEHLQQTSEAAEKHVSDLEVTVQKQAAALHAEAPAPTPPVCTPPAPKPVVKRKPKPKPATPATPAAKPQTTTPPAATTTKPSS